MRTGSIGMDGKREEMQNKAKGIFLWMGAASLISGLTSCAVMDQAECTQANWYAIGRMDGGHGENQFHARQKSCSKHGLGADRPAYDRGLQAGLIGFCTAASGRAHGANGGAYSRGLCPADREGVFLSGYTPAHEKYKFQQRIRQLQSQLALKNDTLSAELRKTSRNDMDIEQLRDEIQNLKRQLQTEMYLRMLD